MSDRHGHRTWARLTCRKRICPTAGPSLPKKKDGTCRRRNQMYTFESLRPHFRPLGEIKMQDLGGSGVRLAGMGRLQAIRRVRLPTPWTSGVCVWSGTDATIRCAGHGMCHDMCACMKCFVHMYLRTEYAVRSTLPAVEAGAHPRPVRGIGFGFGGGSIAARRAEESRYP